MLPAYRDLSDEALFRRYMESQDQTAVRILVDRYRGPMLCFLKKRLRAGTEPDDLWQATLYRLFRARESYDPSRKFSSWIYTIASNLIKNEYRDRTRRPEDVFTEIESRNSDGSPDRGFDVISTGPTPEDITYSEERIKAVHATLSMLEEYYRTPLIMREIEDRTYEEISTSIGIPVGTVKSRLFRAREAFRNAFVVRYGSNPL